MVVREKPAFCGDLEVMTNVFFCKKKVKYKMSD